MIIQFREKAKNPAINVVNPHFEGEVDPKRQQEAEPIKNAADIKRVSDYLIEHGRFRDNLLFIAGVNMGYRCGDLLSLQIGNIVSPDGWVRERVALSEDKTDKYRMVFINDAVEFATTLYLTGKEVDLNDYLFTSLSRSDTPKLYETLKAKRRTSPTRQAISANYVVRYGHRGPISVRSAYRILQKVINDECGIDIHVGTHTLRKTFAYHALMSSPDRNRALELVQRMLNHSSPAITLRYIGITADEIKGVYKGLNLGLEEPAIVDAGTTLERFSA